MEINKEAIRMFLKGEHFCIPKHRRCPFACFALNNPCDCLRYCGSVFPGWKKKQEASQPFNGTHSIRCPCDAMSKGYVVRKFNKWLNE